MLTIDERRLTGLTTLAAFTLVTAILYVAQVVFIPVALAALLTFLLAPVVIRLQRWHLPKPVAVLTTVGVAFVAIGVVAWLVTAQVVGLATELPRYEATLRGKIQQLRGAQEQAGALTKASALVQSLQDDLDAEAPATGTASTSPDRRRAPAPPPVAVEIKPTKPTFVQSLGSIAGPFVGPLGTAGLVVILLIAMLLQREDLRERAVQLLSGGRLNKATEAIDDAARRISAYLLMQLVVNATYGIPIGLGLYFIGVPNALLWGVLATLLRFIPFLGPWIAAAFPIALAFAIDPGWSTLLLTFALFAVAELISNNVVEPWLYGASTGISTVALLVAAVFWTWLWGPVGLFLSTPLTVCLVVMGQHVPGLKILSVLLGSAPVLAPPARMYQRMLAMDYDEMQALTADHLKQQTLGEFYDQVLIPALSLAEEDRHEGTLAEVRQRFIFTSTRELIEDLDEGHQVTAELTDAAPEPTRVLVVPAKDDVDEIAARIVVQLLSDEGIAARLVSATAIASECAETIANEPIELVCVSAVPPAALAAVRQLCRRLGRQCGGVRTIVGVWSPQAEVTDLTARLVGESPDAVVTTVRDAVRRVTDLVGRARTGTMTPAPIPADESARLHEVQRLRLLDAEPDEMFDAITRELARAFAVPISLVSIIDTDRQFWRSHVGLPDDLAAAGEAPRDTSVCGHVVALNEALVVEDVAKDKRFATNPFLVSRGIRFYAGVPLRSQSGHAVGSLCVIDTKPRKTNERDIALLRLLAERLMEGVERRPALVA